MKPKKRDPRLEVLLERIMDSMPGDTIRYNPPISFVGDAVADPKLAPDYTFDYGSASMQPFGFEDGPIKPLEGFNDPVFNLLTLGRELYAGGFARTIQEGIEGAMQMMAKNPKYSIRQLREKLPGIVLGEAAINEANDRLFNEEER